MPPDHSWRPVSLALLGDVDPIKPTIGDTVYPGLSHLFSGEPETLKTLVAQVFAVGLVRAGETVVLIDLEMGPVATLARLRDLGLADEEIDRLVYIEPSEPLTQPHVLADVDRLLAELRPALVIVDSYTPALELHGCNPNDSIDVQRFGRTVVDPLRTHGAAVVLIDHLVKDKERRGKFSTGSERKLGLCDVHLGFEIVKPLSRGGDGLVRLTTHKDRPGFLARPRAAEIAFMSDDTGRLTWNIRPAEQHAEETHTFRPTTLMRRASVYLEHQDEPVSRKQVEESVTGRAEYLRLALDILRSEGYITEMAGARGARLVESVKPFRDGDLVPTSSRSEQADLVPDLVPGETRNGAGSATSSQLVPTSSRTSSNDLVPPSLPPTRGDEVDGTRSNDLPPTLEEGNSASPALVPDAPGTASR